MIDMIYYNYIYITPLCIDNNKSLFLKLTFTGHSSACSAASHPELAGTFRARWVRIRTAQVAPPTTSGGEVAMIGWIFLAGNVHNWGIFMDFPCVLLIECSWNVDWMLIASDTGNILMRRISFHICWPWRPWMCPQERLAIHRQG